jgi:hypothetical protein
MDCEPKGEQPFPSTTWAWRQRKIRRPAGGHSDSAPKGRRWFGLPPRDPSVPLKISVKFRGGPECWYEIHARGGMARYPGWICIHDVMSDINRQT